MRSRTFYALAGGVLFAAACGGEPFTGQGGEAGMAGGSAAGSSATAGGNAGGASSKGGSAGKAGSAGRAGSTGTGGSLVGVAGDVSVGGGVSIGGTQTGEAGTPVTGMSCMAASDCEASSLCKTATCTDGLCGEENAPDDPIKLQVPGDCKQAACQGGKEMLLVDVNDEDDHIECTVDSCDMNGKAAHTNAEAGTLCQGAPADAGQCDGQGRCVDCVNSGGCDEASVCSPDHECIPAP